MFENKSILITGGAGFIGSAFIKYIYANYPKWRVVNLDALTYAGTEENLLSISNWENYHFVKGDINDKALVTKLLIENKITTVIHFAAHSHVDRSISNPEPFLTSNIKGTYSLLEATKKVWIDQSQWDLTSCRFHHISTDEVYGTLGSNDKPFKENFPYAPNSPYAASKAAADHWVRAYFHTYGLPITISNCSNNYGPSQHIEKLIPTVINACLECMPIPIYGDGSNIRDWLYVDDHCEAIDLILRHGKIGETYNIGGNNEISNLDIVKLICAQMDLIRPMAKSYSKLITFVDDRPGHDWRYAIDNGKIKTKLGWQPVTKFEKGLRNTIDHYIQKVSPLDF
ncbi:dTDP-glucose 4,6-dehydratase [Thiotrichales bacterium 19S11-10]|nr:dTDP-glucose 4,6-dehydratase [Thiotrichales bacterium 19S11-10]